MLGHLIQRLQQITDMWIGKCMAQGGHGISILPESHFAKETPKMLMLTSQDKNK